MKNTLTLLLLWGAVSCAVAQQGLDTAQNQPRASEANGAASADVQKAPAKEPVFKKPKKVPVYDWVMASQLKGRFFTVVGNVRCADNTYSPGEMISQCRQNFCGNESCFVDKINPQRQSTEFTPRIDQADAILFDGRDYFTERPRGGAGTFALSMFQNAGHNYVYVELPGAAVKWAEPSTTDFEHQLNRTTKGEQFQQLLRPTLMNMIRDQKLVAYLPLLHAYLPEQVGGPLENWARSSDNWLASEILIELKDPAVKGLPPYLERLLRYSSDRKVRIASAKLLLKLGSRELVDQVARAPGDIQMELRNLLLNF